MLRTKIWDQLCEDYDWGLIDGEDLRRYARVLFRSDQQTSVDSVIRQLEACSV